MTRPHLLLVATLSAMCAVACALFLVMRPSSAPHVRTLGSITPATVAPIAAPSVTASATAGVTATVTDPMSEPVRLTIDKIGVDASVVPVGVKPDTNVVQVPGIADAGWYRYGPTPGQAGSAVLVGHVDGRGSPGVFWRLRDLVPGDEITVRSADGTR